MTSSPAADAATAPALPVPRLVRVVNPDTGAAIHNRPGDTVELVGPQAGLGTPPGEVWVRLRPSFRGLAYDLTSYPESWIREIEHTDGPDCDACPTHEDWILAHCYGCGRAYDAETAALLHQAFHGSTSDEQGAAMLQLAARPSEHKDCLQ